MTAKEKNGARMLSRMSMGREYDEYVSLRMEAYINEKCILRGGLSRSMAWSLKDLLLRRRVMG